MKNIRKAPSSLFLRAGLSPALLVLGLTLLLCVWSPPNARSLGLLPSAENKLTPQEQNLYTQAPKQQGLPQADADFLPKTETFPNSLPSENAETGQSVPPSQPSQPQEEEALVSQSTEQQADHTKKGTVADAPVAEQSATDASTPHIAEASPAVQPQQPEQEQKIPQPEQVADPSSVATQAPVPAPKATPATASVEVTRPAATATAATTPATAAPTAPTVAPQAKVSKEKEKAAPKQRIFGTVEFRGPVKNLPEWQNMLSRHEKNPVFTVGYKYNSNMTWDKLKAMMAGKPPIEQVRGVNSFWNQWPYRLDKPNYGKEDHWAAPYEFIKKSGDCEDYSIAKYFTLKELGFKVEQMRIVVLKDSILNIAHAVLAVYLDDDIYILDNLSRNIISHSRIKHYQPQYSVNEQYRWVHVKPK